jgi:hypothetical protein
MIFYIDIRVALANESWKVRVVSRTHVVWAGAMFELILTTEPKWVTDIQAVVGPSSGLSSKLTQGKSCKKIVIQRDYKYFLNILVFLKNYAPELDTAANQCCISLSKMDEAEN